MPSPVGHSLMGCIIYRATGRRFSLQGWPLIALYLFAANAPDLDFIPGLLVGDANRYHHGASHSIGFAVLFAGALSLFFLFTKKEAIGRNFAIFFSLCCSHVVLDYLGRDSGFPYGVPFFWPLSNTYYIAPFAFFPSVERAASSIAFFPSLFSLNNLWAASVEFFVLFPFILLVFALRQKVESQPNEK